MKRIFRIILTPVVIGVVCGIVGLIFWGVGTLIYKTPIDFLTSPYLTTENTIPSLISIGFVYIGGTLVIGAIFLRVYHSLDDLGDRFINMKYVFLVIQLQ